LYDSSIIWAELDKIEHKFYHRDVDMTTYLQIKAYEVTPLPQQRQILVSVAGSRKYYHILRDTYKQVHQIFDDDDKESTFDWGVYINGDETTAEEIVNLLNMFTKILCIDDSLNQTFALGYHKDIFQKTVYAAKPYHKKLTPANIKAARKLANWFEVFMTRHPAYRNSDFVLPIPFPSQKQFDLPTFIVNAVCQKLGMQNGKQYTRMIRKPQYSMKDLDTIREKMKNVQGIFQVHPNAPFQGKRITIIDDIYESGTTLQTFADSISSTGAIVQAVVATKTKRDPK
jgi:predicted amidophosphoribosyltransferase